MQILGFLGMYFDAVVVEIEKCLLFFRLALAILCIVESQPGKCFLVSSLSRPQTTDAQ